MNRLIWIVLILLLLGGCGFVTVKNNYNSMVVLQEEVNTQQGALQSQYQRRADLIPNLVETAKGYANFEQTTLTQVSEARSRAGSLTLSKEVLENPAQFQQFMQSQNQLTEALRTLRSVVEQYPELKANENFRTLMAQLEGTENRIATERQKFNEAAQKYNTHIKQFPNNLFAGMFSFREVSYFQATAGAEQAPQVNFSN
jgi:LemA protein